MSSRVSQKKQRLFLTHPLLIFLFEVKTIVNEISDTPDHGNLCRLAAKHVSTCRLRRKRDGVSMCL